MHKYNNQKHGRKTFQNCGDWLSAYIISWIFGECLFCVLRPIYTTQLLLKNLACHLLEQLEL